MADRELGLYRFAGEIARSLFLVRTQFSTPYAALAARYLRERAHGALQESMVATTRWILTFAVPVCAAAWLYRDPLLALVAPDGRARPASWPGCCWASSAPASSGSPASSW